MSCGVFHCCVNIDRCIFTLLFLVGAHSEFRLHLSVQRSRGESRALRRDHEGKCTLTQPSCHLELNSFKRVFCTSVFFLFNLFNLFKFADRMRIFEQEFVCLFVCLFVFTGS